MKTVTLTTQEKGKPGLDLRARGDDPQNIGSGRRHIPWKLEEISVNLESWTVTQGHHAEHMNS